MEYLKAENSYTEAMTAHTTPLREQLYRELRGRIQEDDQTVPEPIDDYFYYRRTEEGKQYPIFGKGNNQDDSFQLSSRSTI